MNLGVNSVCICYTVSKYCTCLSLLIRDQTVSELNFYHTEMYTYLTSLLECRTNCPVGDADSPKLMNIMPNCWFLYTDSLELSTVFVFEFVGYKEYSDLS